VSQRPGEEASEKEQVGLRASREVRHTAIRIIAAHLRDGAKESWQGLNSDFTGAIFDGRPPPVEYAARSRETPS
jgi:hypothetical protein